ncbi:MAG TPA: tRNA (adenosine(37)-N6)-dimethylallyltransferase MiaA [Candidatus Limnocylindria bacterium]|nr:tRNA (adenosine(37)-N6)-dimethylallyltransferase MiaA [Candidatus Limnocylindria bacterium]
MAPPRAPLAAIVGPTASGKTDLALALARRLPVEIVVADSRQVYRGMDVGTAKPDADARAAVPHHLLDLVDPDQPITVHSWVTRARAVVPQIAGRGRVPLLVGGTGLYVSALVDGYRLAAGPASPQLRRELAAALEAEGLDAMVARLGDLDPEAAALTDPRNPRRVLRALERAAVASGSTSPAAEPWAGRLALLGLSRPADVLRQRIAERTAAMFAGGLLDEARQILAAGYDPALAPLSGHGYREAIAVVTGEWPLERAIETTERHTRQYAKRQMTWFRRDPRIVWLTAGDRPADEPALVARAEELLRALLA